VLLKASETGLPRDSIANVSQFVTVDRDYLEERLGTVPKRALAKVAMGVRVFLEL
jgi:mRNA interferase MazF